MNQSTCQKLVSRETEFTDSNTSNNPCDREQVQFCQAVQPHGVLLVLRRSDLVITAASTNTISLLGQPVKSVLHKPFQDVFPQVEAEFLLPRLMEDHLGAVPAHLGRVSIRSYSFDVFAHRLADELIIELELVSQHPAESAGLYKEVRSYLSSLFSASSVSELLQLAVVQIRKLTGFSRVFAYKFLDDGTGHILAEDRREDLPGFIDLHFPPGDVPAPARRVLSLLWVRYQPDIAYKPVPIEFAEQRRDPLDLSYSLLRSTSPNCNQYYQNLGVLSKVVIALKREGELWGMIVCQSEKPTELLYERRMACETIAHSISLCLRSKEEQAESHKASQVRHRTEALIDSIIETPTWGIPLERDLLNCLEVGGVGAMINGSLFLQGLTPTEPQVRDLIRWLDQLDPALFASAYSTSCLSSQYPDANGFRAEASGLLAARLEHGDYLLWFRPEKPYEITWAGDPQKPMIIDQKNGTIRFAPRTSFQMQRTLLQGCADSWKNYEIEMARALKRAIVNIKGMDTLQKKLAGLEKTKSELESFAYIASHDLREPLRGIRCYSQMLSFTLGDTIPSSELTQLELIGRMAERMDNLLTALLQCSRAQRLQINPKLVDLNQLVQAARETTSLRLANGEIRVLGSLPHVWCDPTLIQQVIVNLIVNGIKYNNSSQKIIEIGTVPEPEQAIFVRDNGIGIPPESHEEVFRLFRRLNGRSEFGEGTGAGLAIVKQIIEQHGGRIWLESQPGQGSTFYFVLPQNHSADLGWSVN